MKQAQPPAWDPGDEPITTKFEAAWNVFAASCGHLWANEASFQAWFAHYLIGQFGIDRVAREPVINEKYFRHTPGAGEVRPDAVVMRTPGIMVPHYANRLAKADDESGIGLLNRLAVVSELKIGISTSGPLTTRIVEADLDKLGRLLTEHQAEYGGPPPLAYACVLDNHPMRAFDPAPLRAKLEAGGFHPGVRLLFSAAVSRPATPDGGRLHW